ncbi:energy-coupling factor transporter transmembrane component T family protein [Bifidobacterium actinocoloniiforme]|uniref:energy-coupling factor transporter transmembrane component T family protein n=1 Tax=Bifidobacterium actinocoloniiforme TaxID=638619 RepID=UPI000AA8DDC6|nr:energy-coupling factor transporter transmembrane component T [Bifidobacterium actinocoloniiforme]
MCIFSKFFLVVFANALLFFNLPIWLQAASYAYLCLLFLPARRWRQAGMWLAVCAVFVAGDACVLLYPDNLLGHYLLFLFSALGKMLPVVVVAALIFSTTRVSELVYGLRTLRLPQWVVVPMSVLFRFFPTIRHDYHQIRDAMKFRGIAVNGSDLALHPLRSMEYIYVPLLNNASNVAGDLTAAALTRGLADPQRKTSLYGLSVFSSDLVCLIVGLGLLGCLAYA